MVWIHLKVDIPQSSAAVQSLIEASCGSMDNSWEVGWSLASHGRGPQNIDSSQEQVTFLLLSSKISQNHIHCFLLSKKYK